METFGAPLMKTKGGVASDLLNCEGWVSTRAKAAYQEFLALWSHADENIPVFQEAKAAYAKLP